MDNFMERLQKAMNENDTKAMNNEKLQRDKD